ncbi:MAG TPA: lysylphosphatidylglycerol synthase transmembrane domain-containing protein, partial [Desulfatiglandales bacterium]|nr:lysylphosphatidylglycerol synthase transmembrane domain-containing protein [Desulfatiglandales bacterium]
ANYIGRMENISKSSSFATIVVERLFDIFTILLILLFVILFTDFPFEWKSVEIAVKTGGILMFFFFVISIGLLVMLKQRTQTFINIVERLTFFLPVRAKQKILDMLQNFSKGLVLIKGPYQLLTVIFYSFVLWGLTVFQIYAIGLSMDLSLPFLAPFFILVLLCFSVTIPSAPGYIGTFHLACQYGLVFYGFSHEKALSMAIVLHAAGFVPTVILGLLIFLQQHISLSNYVSRNSLLKK